MLDGPDRSASLHGVFCHLCVRTSMNVFSYLSSSSSSVGLNRDQNFNPSKHLQAPILLAPAHFQPSTLGTTCPSDAPSAPSVNQCFSHHAHNVPADQWKSRICPLRLSACLCIHAIKHNNPLLIDSLQPDLWIRYTTLTWTEGGWLQQGRSFSHSWSTVDQQQRPINAESRPAKSNHWEPKEWHHSRPGRTVWFPTNYCMVRLEVGVRQHKHQAPVIMWD